MIAAGLNKKGRVMRLRSLLCGLAIFGMAEGARAADLGEAFLRGSTVIAQPGGTRWDGFYVGGHVGANWSGADFGEATKDLVGFSLRESALANVAGVPLWNVLGKYDTSGSSLGGFVGYNTQWDGAIVGVELSYSRTKLALAAADSIALNPNGFPDGVIVDASASTRITDYGTARVRGGWAAGIFMPYGFVGVAVARADANVTTTTSLYRPLTAIVPYFVDTRTQGKTGDFAYGYTAGLGMDICVYGNFFVRGEYEYVQFGAFNDIKLHIHTARVGAGLKF